MNKNEIVIKYPLDIDPEKITPEQFESIKNKIVQRVLETVTYDMLRISGNDDQVSVPYSQFTRSTP